MKKPDEAMHDLRALQLPEERKGRVFVEALIQEPAGQTVPLANTCAKTVSSMNCAVVSMCFLLLRIDLNDIAALPGPLSVLSSEFGQIRNPACLSAATILPIRSPA